jgi:protein SCO1/2
MAEMLDSIKETIPTSKGNPELLPVFITCDPARDTPAVLKTYLQEFHPDIVGLTGPWDQIKAVCKLYRVYFSTPPGVKPGQDYLVDHSIYFYLMGMYAGYWTGLLLTSLKIPKATLSRPLDVSTLQSKAQN